MLSGRLYNNIYRETPNNHITPMSEHFGDSGKEKLRFNRKPQTEAGSGRKSHLSQTVRDEGGRQDKNKAL